MKHLDNCLGYIKTKNFRTQNFWTKYFGQKTFGQFLATKNAKEKEVKIAVWLIIAVISDPALGKNPPSLTLPIEITY